MENLSLLSGAPVEVSTEAIEQIDFDAYTRMVQLFFDGPGAKDFREMAVALQAAWGTKNLTETVEKAVRRAYSALNVQDF